MTGKIFRAIMTVVCGVLLASVLIILGCLYDYFEGLQVDQLWAQLDMAAVGVEKSGEDYLDTLNIERERLTWIAEDGSVLYDARADQDTMENHANREEVKAAMESGKGSSERYSDTLFEKTVYCAKRLSDGSVLRISVSRVTIAALVLGMLQPICIVVMLSLVLALFLAHRLSGRIVKPLNDLDLDHPLENRTYDEIAPLLRRINQQHVQIRAQLRELERKSDEFYQITASMNEGLVLLDNKGVVLSINPAAARLFGANENSVGSDFLTIERTRELSDAMSAAMNRGHAEIMLERGSRIFQTDVSRIESNGTTIGMVLLIFDVTERVDAERTRREFTANVSHELKTPLTAIMGSSELLQSGMVKSEDASRFIGHIHDEAARLLTLIEDIIRLSQLDEGVDIPKEEVNLARIAQEVSEQLSDKAKRCNVTLNVNAQECSFKGVMRLCHEIAYNLVENAIKYNVDGGNVDISMTSSGVLTVKDTGIGIPPEHQQRVFERFYRVDKSHSKQIGGTGLGLSIVKHAAAYLNAEISMESEPGKGTTITVKFPVEK